MLGHVETTSPAECVIENCTKPAKTAGLCRMHHMRQWRHGTVAARPKPSAQERFWAKVDTSGECWIWLGSTTSNGYGQFWPAPKTKVVAHRYAFEAAYGAIDSGKQLDHLCRNTRCVRPSHLEAVTGRENVLRGLTLPAANAAKTHCAQGHPYDEANTSHTGKQRRCIECSRRWSREWQRKRRAQLRIS